MLDLSQSSSAALLMAACIAGAGFLAAAPASAGHGAESGSKAEPATADGNAVSGEVLVRRLWRAVEEQDMTFIESHIAQGFQSSHSDGARNRDQELALINDLDVGDYELSNFESTRNGDVIVVTYDIAVAETIAGQRLSSTPAPRLSVWQKTDQGWQWIAHANLKPLQ